MLHISSSMDPSPPYHYSRTATRSWYRPGPEGFARECCTHPFGPLASAPLAERVCSGQGTRPFAKGLKVRVPKGRKVHLALLAEGVSFGRRCAFQKRAPSPVRLCLMRQQKPGFPVREISFAFLYFLAFVGPRSSTHCAAHMANAIQSLADACSARSAHCSCRFMLNKRKRQAFF